VSDESYPPTHPVFASDSLYGQATRESVRADSGHDSIRRLFRRVAREHLQGRYRAGDVPERAPDWGFGDEVNRLVHERMRQKHARREVRVAALANRPLLWWVCDLRNPAAIQPHSPPPPLERWTFSESSKNREEPTTAKFFINRNLGQGRVAAAVFLLTTADLEHLAGALDEGSSWSPLNRELPRRRLDTDDDRRRALQEVFAPENLEPPPDAPETAFLRAERLVTCLAQAPTLLGETDAAGDLNVEVDLGGDFPHLPDDTLVVLCLGPAARDEPGREGGDAA
jgi:hypothetical protein